MQMLHISLQRQLVVVAAAVLLLLLQWGHACKIVLLQGGGCLQNKRQAGAARCANAMVAAAVAPSPTQSAAIRYEITGTSAFSGHILATFTLHVHAPTRYTPTNGPARAAR